MLDTFFQTILRRCKYLAKTKLLIKFKKKKLRFYNILNTYRTQNLLRTPNHLP